MKNRKRVTNDHEYDLNFIPISLCKTAFCNFKENHEKKKILKVRLLRTLTRLHRKSVECWNMVNLIIEHSVKTFDLKGLRVEGLTCIQMCLPFLLDFDNQPQLQAWFHQIEGYSLPQIPLDLQVSIVFFSFSTVTHDLKFQRQMHPIMFVW